MEEVSYLNNKDKCIVCFKAREKDFELIGHHVSYFPEIVAFVHYTCHAKIHDLEKPIAHLIQYEEGDSNKFYEEKKVDQ